ncbi:SDR family oxidoreductase [Sphingomonas antarctica]|uniref:SDR family NAD(P)-dependent oxidoreductase n=1 Tax=Sphingomonas antarctica TaxID=2040274 RepID=UPI0039EBA1D1
MAGLAIVTGASAGLGVGFAESLAAKGHDLLLVARRADRLDDLAAKLRATGVKVDVAAADLGAEGGVAAVVAAIGGRPVDLLINNAGSGLRGDFAKLDIAAQSAMVRLNCTSLMELSHAVLPGMIAAKAGGILNVASTAAFQPGPWMAVYYATKAFVLSFSEALHEEVKPHGVRVSALCPGPTKTEFADVAGMGESALFKMMGSGPDPVVRDGLAALEANQAVKISGAMNFMMAESIRLTPRGLARSIAGRLQKSRADG